VDFEWRRLTQLVIVVGGLAAAGELALPTSGAVGFIARAAVWAIIPPALLATGFAHGAELRQARLLLARLRAVRPQPSPGES
jgi:hypothetical protein